LTFFRLAVAALLLALLSLSLKEAGVKGAPFVLLGAGVLVIFPILERLMSLLSFLRAFSEKSEAAPYFSAVIKVMGIGYVTHFSAESCRESGATTLASRVELCGQLETVLVCLPYIEELLSLSFLALS
jgi:stage III sporulation protein AD